VRIIDGNFIAANGSNQTSLRVGVADSWLSRFLGLMGRSKMPGIDCLRFDSCSTIHTCFMRMRIDVVYLDEHGVALKLCRGLRPWRMSFCFGANVVLEFGSGSLEKLGIAEGWIFKCY
jgi:uncharacterized membrane protein (UPF0127 family)